MITIAGSAGEGGGVIARDPAVSGEGAHRGVGTRQPHEPKAFVMVLGPPNATSQRRRSRPLGGSPSLSALRHPFSSGRVFLYPRSGLL